MIEIKEALHVLRVADVRRSIEWYEDTLGFSAAVFPEEPPYAFAIVHYGTTRLMLRQHDGYVRDEGLKDWDVYFALGGGRLRDFYEDLRERATVTRELERMPYGDVEFDVVDPDGYVLCFSEKIADSTVPAARAL